MEDVSGEDSAEIPREELLKAWDKKWAGLLADLPKDASQGKELRTRTIPSMTIRDQKKYKNPALVTEYSEDEQTRILQDTA